MSNLHALKLINLDCDIQDDKFDLGFLKKLTFLEINKIPNVQLINVKECQNLQFFSILNCKDIKKISLPNTIQKIKIENCEELAELSVPAANNINYLKLSNCKNLPIDLSIFQQVKIMHLAFIKELENPDYISKLNNITKLVLYNFSIKKNFLDLSNMHHLKEVTLWLNMVNEEKNKYTETINFSGNALIDTIFITGYSGITSLVIPQIDNGKQCIINTCNVLEQLTFGTYKNTEILYCPELQNIKTDNDIKSIKIFNCPKIEKNMKPKKSLFFTVTPIIILCCLGIWYGIKKEYIKIPFLKQKTPIF